MSEENEAHRLNIYSRIFWEEQCDKETLSQRKLVLLEYIVEHPGFLTFVITIISFFLNFWFYAYQIGNALSSGIDLSSVEPGLSIYKVILCFVFASVVLPTNCLSYKGIKKYGHYESHALAHPCRLIKKTKKISSAYNFLIHLIYVFASIIKYVTYSLFICFLIFALVFPSDDPSSVIIPTIALVVILALLVAIERLRKNRLVLGSFLIIIVGFIACCLLFSVFLPHTKLSAIPSFASFAFVFAITFYAFGPLVRMMRWIQLKMASQNKEGEERISNHAVSNDCSNSLLNYTIGILTFLVTLFCIMTFVYAIIGYAAPIPLMKVD